MSFCSPVKESTDNNHQVELDQTGEKPTFPCCHEWQRRCFVVHWARKVSEAACGEGNNTDRKGKVWFSPAAQMVLLAFILHGPTDHTYVSWAGNTFSDFVLISWQKWWKGGDVEESETWGHYTAPSVCVGCPGICLPQHAGTLGCKRNQLKQISLTCHCSFSEDFFCQVALL